MKVVILAAGEGTRLNKGWTIVPKPLLEVNGLTIIEHVITSFRDAGFKEFIVVVGFMSEHIKDYLRNGVEHGVDISYVYNEDYKQGILSSLQKVKGHVKGSFVVAMADLFFASKVVKEIDGLQGNFVLIDRKIKEVRRLEEKMKIQCEGNKVRNVSLQLQEFDAVDCGIYIFTEEIFDLLEKHENKIAIDHFTTGLANKSLLTAIDIGEHSIIDIDREKDVEFILNIHKRRDGE